MQRAVTAARKLEGAAMVGWAGGACGGAAFSGPAGSGIQMPIGGDEEDRTPDLRIANATLSQLSYAPTNVTKFITGHARGQLQHGMAARHGGTAWEMAANMRRPGEGARHAQTW